MASRLLRAARRVPGWWKVRSLLLPGLAALHRRRLDGVTFVGITGSAGKTTTKRLATAVLETAGRIQLRGGANTPDDIMAHVIATAPTDAFCAIEFSAFQPGYLDRSLATVRPRIGVVTSIGTDHLKAFHSMDAIAEEKVKLVACLPSDGVAVLNADDPRVLAMAQRCRGRVITFGLSAQADLRAEQVRSAWPERLSFAAVYEGTTVAVNARLCGSHWATAVLAALAVGIAAGIPLAQGARAIEAVEPYPSRMCPATNAKGVTFILDDWKSSIWLFPAVFEFLAAARARRKIMIIGTLADYGGTTATVYSRIASGALQVADCVLFVGPMATHALRARRPESADRLHAFATVKEAAAFLETLLQEGDLVLVKGSMNADHLGRVAHHFLEPITCWRTDCRKNMPCSACLQLRAAPAPAPARRVAGTATAEPVRTVPAALAHCHGPFEVIVGIGNPGPRHRGTPHNVGFAVADALAERLDLQWTACEAWALAHTTLQDRTLLLVKPQKYVNNTGECLKRLADELSFTAKDCILVQDDIHLPLGKLRWRARGSDGGHKGIRSALVAFQTDGIRRLKIGVAPPAPVAAQATATRDYLIAPFMPEAAAVIAPAIGAAVDRLLEMVENQRRPPGNDATGARTAMQANP